MESENKLNRVMLITFILVLVVGIITLFIILNKGKIFGKRLVKISEEVVKKEIVHSMEIACDKQYLAVNSKDVSNLVVTIDGVEMKDGFEYEISDETLVKIENNKVRVMGKEGTVVIKAKSLEYELEAETTIEIVEPITKLYIQLQDTNIDINEQVQVRCTFKPTNATPVVEYSVLDESIATVDENGILTGVSTGTVLLTARDTVTGIGASCKIKIK